MICKVCGREFEKHRPNQRYCEPACRKRAHCFAVKRRELERINFELEWAAWKRDFALGKTKSNLEVTA